MSNLYKFAITKNFNTKLLAQGYKSLIVAVFPYFYPENVPLFSKYCSIYDYHNVVKEEFKKALSGFDFEYKIFSDISPFKEKDLAHLLGLGEIGRNNLLLTKDYSSFVFIGEAAVKEDLEEVKYSLDTICLKCNKCVNACPTGALTNGFEKEKCLSFLTQKKDLTKDEELMLKGTEKIWGCDICQLVCPITKNAKTTFIEKFKKPVLDLDENKILNMDIETFKNYSDFAFFYKGLDILKRNIKII